MSAVAANPPRRVPKWLTRHETVLALILVGPLMGLGRAALKIAVEKAPKRAVNYTRLATQRDSTAFQLKLSEAAMTLDDGILHAKRAAEAMSG